MCEYDSVKNVIDLIWQFLIFFLASKGISSFIDVKEYNL